VGLKIFDRNLLYLLPSTNLCEKAFDVTDYYGKTTFTSYYDADFERFKTGTLESRLLALLALRFRYYIIGRLLTAKLPCIYI
jgi:hypothetical protein